MSEQRYRWILLAVMLLARLTFAQEIPRSQPRLLPLPGLETGLAYFRLIPTQNVQLSSSAMGWSLADTLPGIATTFDLELLRFTWGDYLLKSPRLNVSSSLDYARFLQLGNISLPGSFPRSFLLHNTVVSGFHLNSSIKEILLKNTFCYFPGKRHELHAALTIGYAGLQLYQNGADIRILSAGAPVFQLDMGWRFTLLGHTGKRIRLGLDAGYALRNFTLDAQQDGLLLTDGNSGPLTPIQSIAFNTPHLKVNLEMGEALLGSYTPYRDPYRLRLLRLGVSTGYTAYRSGTGLQYDTTGTSLSPVFLTHISQDYELQLFQYNWLFHFLKQADADLLSGVGVRLWKTSQPTPLPENWAHEFTNGRTIFSGMSFAPRITDWYLNHELILPLGPRFYTKFSGATGWGQLTLYENGIKQRLIEAQGFTWQLGGGLGFTFQGDGSSKVDLGIRVGYLHQAFSIDWSSSGLMPTTVSQLMPLTFIDLSQPIVAVTIGLIFGGSENMAQKAHQAFLKKNYAKALELQDELLQLNPEHHNRQLVLLEKQMVNDSLVTSYYRKVRRIVDQGKLESAYILIQQGKRPPNENLQVAVDQMQIEIATKALERAAGYLRVLNFTKGEDMILLALKNDPSTFPIAKILLARAYIIRATVLYQSSVYQRSLYWLKQADSLTDRYRLVTARLRQRIGDGRLDDANEGILKQDRHMVYDSMEDAKNLNPVLANIVDEHLKNLKAAMDFQEEQRLGSMKRMALDNLLNDISGLDPDNFEPRVGMRGVVVARYIGPPSRRFREAEYDLWVYPKSDRQELWLYLRNDVIEKVELQSTTP